MTEGGRGRGSGPGHAPWHGPGPSGCVPPGSGPAPRTGGWLAARPASPGVRLECGARGQGPRGSQTPPVQQAAQGQTRPGLQEAALCHRLSVAVSAAGEGGMRFQCERPSVPGLCPSAHRGPRSSSSHNGGKTPGPRCLSRREVGPGPREGGRIRGLRQPRGGRAGRQTGGGVFGAWQMQGLIAGASLGPDPGTGSGGTGGDSGTGPGPTSPSSLNPPLPP